jgi:hypothetical protein
MKNEILAAMEGKQILGIEAEIMAAVPLGVSTDDEVTIKTPLKITVDDYILFIYNRWELKAPKPFDVNRLKGGKISDIEYRSDALQIKFSDEARIDVDVSENGYVGPESLVLYGPEGEMVVWE